LKINVLYRSGKIGALWFISLALLVMFWFGCGKKAPPVPPSEKPPAVVGDLSAVLAGETAGKDAPAKRPNFVWLLSEDNSVHYMDMYFKTGASTPKLQTLAKEWEIPAPKDMPPTELSKYLFNNIRSRLKWDKM